MDIHNKIAAVTGVSSGIGKAIAMELATHGVKLVLGARRAAELESVVTTIRQRGGEAVAVTMDVKNRNDVRQLVDTAIAQYGRLDVMINNAGTSHFRGQIKYGQAYYDFEEGGHASLPHRAAYPAVYTKPHD